MSNEASEKGREADRQHDRGLARFEPGMRRRGAQSAARQVEIDAYTRYELQAPGSGKFRIVYEVTDATPGASAYFNPIRKGSVATDERVSDRATAFKVSSPTVVPCCRLSARKPSRSITISPAVSP